MSLSLLPSFPRALFRGLAYRLLAIAHWEKGDHGNGIALLQQAQDLLKTRQDVASTGLPNITESHYLSKYKPQVGEREFVGGRWVGG